MAQHENRKDNCLLAALGNADWARWQPQVECVDLARGQTLSEPGQALRYAYFPINAVVSLTSLLANGESTGIAFVGNEGVVGTSLLLCAGATTKSSGVLIAGRAFRIGARAIQEEFRRSDTVRGIFLHYIQALVTQIGQTAICTRHHSIDQRLCGLLLHSLDRLQDDEVAVTQELIAGVLGVRRESVTAAAVHLKEAGLIDYSRGHIVVLDRAGLEQRACECHAVVKQEYDRLLSLGPAALPAVPGRRTWPAHMETV